MGSLLKALYNNPLLPTPHWQPRCELCGLRNTHPEDYGWLTRQLTGLPANDEPPLTQTEIAAELERRTGLSITQSQVSNHKTKHLDPSLADAIESMTGHLVMIEYFAGMDAGQMAVGYAKLALAKLGQLMQETTSPKSASSLGGAQAALMSILQRADKQEAETALAEVSARLAAMKEERETTDYAMQFSNWVRTITRTWKPILADPEKLAALLAAVGAEATP